MKLFRLTYNEFIKQFKKLSTKLIFALILLSAIAIPMVVKNINPQSYDTVNEDSIRYNISQLESQIQELENKSNYKDKMYKKYAEIDKESDELLLTHSIAYEDWQRIEVDEYRIASQRLANMEFVLQGFTESIVLENAQGQAIPEIEKYYTLTKEKKKEIEQDLIKEKEELLQVINTNDYKKHIELSMERIEEYISIHEETVKEYEDFKAKNINTVWGKNKLEELRISKEDSELRIEEFKQDLSLLEFRLKEDINFEEDNWKNKAILEIEEILSEYRTKMLDEKEFNLDYNQSLSNTYEGYVKGFEEANKKREERIKELWYSLENNIPHLGAVKDARSVIDSSYELFVVLGVVMAIIIGGPIVANEFSSGSIRLLLIRPVARWKVLLAKLSLVLLVGYSIVVLGTTILTITSGYVFGLDTLDIPVIQTINNQIVQTDYLSYMIPQLITSTASLIFVASVVFMVSTLSKNTALAVAVGMLLYIGTPILSQVLISAKQTWLLDTVIPYINGSYFKLLPGVAEQLSNSGLTLNFEAGAVQLLAVSVVVLIITFISFTKRDVKN